MSPEVVAPNTVRRIRELEALRGLALAGIVFSNLPTLMHMEARLAPGGQLLPIPTALERLTHQRFLPIYSFLFGIGFALILQNGRVRTDRPRLVLLRRLLMLLAIGTVHQIFHPGEALTVYAIGSLVVLLPVSYLRRPVVATAAVAAVTASVTLAHGGLALSLALVLAGYAAQRYDLAQALVGPRAGRPEAVLFVIFLVASAGGILWQTSDLLHSGFSTSSAVAGLAVAGCWATGLLLLLRTPARSTVYPILESLGRTALTNYVGSTVIVLTIGPLIDMWESTDWTNMLVFAFAIIIVQALISRWWLTRFTYGPLEWAWRVVSWWKIIPLRRAASPTPHVY